MIKKRLHRGYAYELKSKYGATLVGNSLISFGRKLKNIDGIIHRHSSNGTEYLIVRRS